MTQEEQTALVEGQAAANAAATDAKKDDQVAAKQVEGEQAAAGDAAAAEPSKGAGGQENQAQMRALFKQIIRMRSVRKLSPAAKAAKAARQAARAAANAAKAAEVAAKAADSAAKAAQDAAQAAFEENAKAEAGEKQQVVSDEKPVATTDSKSEQPAAENAAKEEVAAK